MIFRPSIVISTWRDPIAGYIDNFNGPGMRREILK
jgi:hypothetical protein